ncbi:hypothetical protein [Acetobacter oeni]|uniref:hypothetical protein n=1 Tax=Acetobacter oeni TaxID=304077 RepID=UPI001567EC9D|nr:hypothetical protein [Acetobacter oeni]MBB3884940.1 hypothetical protein [Acetobacter oeni]NHO20823.1 hypothetical protein [Acetobacter oeni]
MVKTVTDLVADLDTVTDALEAYRIQLRAQPLAHTCTGDCAPPHGDEASLRLPVRPPIPSQAPRPPGLGHSMVVETQPESGRAGEGGLMGCAQPDWLYHLLTVEGPPERLAQFRTRAAGPGRIPWAAEALSADDLLRPLLPPGAGSEAGRLTGLAEAVARAAERLRVRDGGVDSVPFDLNALCPVPVELLTLGPQSPDVVAWLCRHWGTSRPLQTVEAVEAGPVAPETVWTLGFWSADWTPWAALRTIARDWPDLCLRIRPFYDV